MTSYAYSLQTIAVSFGVSAQLHREEAWRLVNTGLRMARANAGAHMAARRRALNHGGLALFAALGKADARAMVDALADGQPLA